MKKETKRMIRALGTVLFILYVLALIYFLFFSEEYGRIAMEEREYRYNLIPFVEIRRFWVYRKQLGGGIYKPFWKCGRISAIWLYAACDHGKNEKRISDHTGRIRTEPYSRGNSAYNKSRMF